MEAPVGLLPEGIVYRSFGYGLPRCVVSQFNKIVSKFAGFRPSESARTSVNDVKFNSQREVDVEYTNKRAG
jgi:hypothetical protein